MSFDLKTARLNAGLSQRQLAAEVAVSRVVVQRLENGLGVSPGNAKRIADYFGTTVVELLPSDREVASASS